VPVEVVFVLGRWNEAELAVQASVIEWSTGRRLH
jgi:hypothetical protein